jgi:hypothetical protein
MRWWAFVSLIVVVTLGCGAAKEHGRETARLADELAASRQQASAGEGKQGQGVPSGNAIRRKIIYRATVEIVVEDFDPVQSKVDALVKQFDAYLAKSNISGKPGTPRSGRWTVRVPAERYDAFLEAARELGEVRRVSSDSQDVTEEFYDVEARIRNKKQEESRLIELLKTATGKLEEVLAVEKEISRVRGEVEQLEGRMRVLADLTTLATVELQVDEIKDYVPEEAATYSTRVRRALQGSIVALKATAQNLSIAAVALAPWLAVLVVVLVPLGLWARARRKRRAIRAQAPVLAKTVES